MLGIVTELLLSWLLLHFTEKKNLSVLAFTPSTKRISNFCIGFLLAVVCCAVYHLLTTAFTDNSWRLNKQITIATFFYSAWWTLRSVLFEELMFRGALLYIAIEKLGVKKASLLSAVVFGIFHWFTFNSFQPFQMFLIFFMTGLFGYVLALAFAATRSIYLPIALHFGWNLINIVVFSNGPLGQQLFIKENANHLDGTPSLLVFVFQVFAVPVCGYFYIRQIAKKQKGRYSIA